MQGQVVPVRVESQRKLPALPLLVMQKLWGILTAVKGRRQKRGAAAGGDTMGAKGYGRVSGREKGAGRGEKGMKKHGREQGKSSPRSKRTTSPWGLM